MENKYRTPSIDEFVPGFNYEFSLEVVNDALEITDRDDWAKKVVRKDSDLLYIEYFLKFNIIRVLCDTQKK